MAETMLVAFGRFLRLLRERRGLSLDQVEALTSAYPEPVSKVYLSRIENGHSKIAFSRMIAICRAYEYPIDAASERLWLDLGVDRMEDPPDTAGKGAKELLREGRSYIQRGFRWHAYACARDAIAVAKTTPVSESFRDEDEQFAICLMNTATGSAKLGRYRFAFSEYQHLERNPLLQPKHAAVVLGQMASTLRGLGKFTESANYAERAIAEASREDADEFLGECLISRALTAYSMGSKHDSAELHHSALRHYRRRKDDAGAANVLVNLAQLAFEDGRAGAARRFLAAADRIAQRLKLGAIRARVLILTGEIQEAAGDDDAAERCWQEGQRVSTQLGDPVLSFKVKYFLFRSAVRRKRPAIARKIERSLERMSPWIPLDTEELTKFRAETRHLEPNPVSDRFRGGNKPDQETRTQDRSPA